MIYQLPNGKVLWLTMEEYLNLTDEEITYIISLGYGDSPSSPWTGSALSENTRQRSTSSEDDGLDYRDMFDDYGSDVVITVSFDELDIDGFPDVPDEDVD